MFKIKNICFLAAALLAFSQPVLSHNPDYSSSEEEDDFSNSSNDKKEKKINNKKKSNNKEIKPSLDPLDISNISPFVPAAARSTHLDISSNQIGPEGIIALIEAVQLGYLTRPTLLDIGSNLIGPEGLEALNEAITNLLSKEKP